MTTRGGRNPREPMAAPADAEDRRPNGYQRTGRYGRGPGDQRRYDRYGRRGGGIGGVLRFALFLVVLAAGVLLAMATVARPLVRMAVVPWAEGNPSVLRIGIVADLVREDLGPALTTPAGGDPAGVEFTVDAGDTPTTLAARLQIEGLITSQRAFLFEARMADLGGKLHAGAFTLSGNMTPGQVVDGLINSRVIVRTVDVTFREGLRLEQMTAKLQTLTDTQVDPKEFYRLATKPTDAILGDYPWLLDTSIRPKGAGLEGFLYPATYTLRIDGAAPTNAEALIRMMLDAFYRTVGPERLDVAAKRGLSFYEILTLASIVEREAVLDEERPLIAGVYQNRLNPKMWPIGLLQSDPTIFYTNDTIQLDEIGFPKWPTYVFWAALRKDYQLPVPLPAGLAGYNTYTSRGLPPAPICSPALASLDAALAPDTRTGYLFFIAKGDGSGSSAFAKTLAQHQKNVAKYGKK